MATLVPYATRREIVKRKLTGESLRAIAFALLLSFRVTRKWWRRFRCEGEAGLVLRPVPPGQGPMSRFSPLIRAEALRWKQARPRWSAARIQRQMAVDRRFAGHRLPSTRTLNRFFAFHRVLGQPPPPQVSPPAGWAPTWGAQVEWQVDLKEDVRIEGIGTVTFVHIYDIGSGLLIESYPVTVSEEAPSPPRDLTWTEIRRALREAFRQWGLPRRIRTDRGSPFLGSEQSVLPSLLTLWLAGLGIEPRLNEQAHSPQLNGGVERLHQTLARRVWEDMPFESLEALREALCREIPSLNAHEIRHARASYDQIPLVAHPEAAHTGRPYPPDPEAALFDVSRVWTHLAQHVLTRRVGKTGQVSLNDLPYSVGRSWAGQTVTVTLDAASHQVVFSIEGVEVKRQPLRGFVPEDLISEQAPRSRKRPRGTQKESLSRGTSLSPDPGASEGTQTPK